MQKDERKDREAKEEYKNKKIKNKLKIITKKEVEALITNNTEEILFFGMSSIFRLSKTTNPNPDKTDFMDV